MGSGYKSTSYSNELHGTVMGDIKSQLRTYGSKLKGRPTLILLQSIFATDLMTRKKEVEELFFRQLKETANSLSSP